MRTAQQIERMAAIAAQLGELAINGTPLFHGFYSEEFGWTFNLPNGLTNSMGGFGPQESFSMHLDSLESIVNGKCVLCDTNPASADNCYCCEVCA